MNKTVLERFIAKYNLGGTNESVILTADKGSLSTKFITDDKNAAGFVTAKKLQLESGEYGVYDTAQLRSMLTVLDEEITPSINKKADGTPVSLTLTDGSTKVSYALADKSNIPASPNMKNLPEYEVVIELNQKFVNTFTKAKAALPEVTTFTVVVKNGAAEVVLGFSDHNTNKINIATDSQIGSEIEPISFPSQYLREILVANKEMSTGLLRVSSKGVAHVQCEVEDFSVDYYLVKVQ